MLVLSRKVDEQPVIGESRMSRLCRSEATRCESASMHLPRFPSSARISIFRMGTTSYPGALTKKPVSTSAMHPNRSELRKGQA